MAARQITVKYNGHCTLCGGLIRKGATALWTGRGALQCASCLLDQNADRHSDTQMFDTMIEEAAELWYASTYGNDNNR